MNELDKLAREVHAENINWWRDINTGQLYKRNRGELIMLIVTEFAEAVEGIRKNLMDDKLPRRRMEEVEMADAVIRILDFAGGYNVPLVDLPLTYDYIRAVTDNKCEAVMFMSREIIRAHGTTPAGVTDALSATILLVRAYCSKHGLDLAGAIVEKRAFNRDRADHKIENRLKEGGKKI